MAAIERKSIDKPDETRTFPNGRLELVTIGDLAFGRATLEPAWRWSESVKPLAGTPSCEVHHNGYIVSGSLHIVMDDGTELDLNAGDVFVCPPGHDAWVTSSEPVVAYDFSGAAGYAKPIG
jgi:mannose-6-phosphate isomerase-like protein (cupin superfamily)